MKLSNVLSFLDDFNYVIKEFGFQPITGSSDEVNMINVVKTVLEDLSILEHMDYTEEEKEKLYMTLGKVEKGSKNFDFLIETLIQKNKESMVKSNLPQDELDRILDLISENGYESLSNLDKKLLKSHSDNNIDAQQEIKKAMESYSTAKGVLDMIPLGISDSEMDKNIGKYVKFKPVDGLAPARTFVFEIVAVQKIWDHDEKGSYNPDMKGYRLAKVGVDNDFGMACSPKEIDFVNMSYDEAIAFNKVATEALYKRMDEFVNTVTDIKLLNAVLDTSGSEYYNDDTYELRIGFRNLNTDLILTARVYANGDVEYIDVDHVEEVNQEIEDPLEIDDLEQSVLDQVYNGIKDQLDMSKLKSYVDPEEDREVFAIWAEGDRVWIDRERTGTIDNLPTTSDFINVRFDDVDEVYGITTERLSRIDPEEDKLYTRIYEKGEIITIRDERATPAEKGREFVVSDDRGGRLLISPNWDTGMSIVPTELIRKSDVGSLKLPTETNKNKVKTFDEVEIGDIAIYGTQTVKVMDKGNGYDLKQKYKQVHFGMFGDKRYKYNNIIVFEKVSDQTSFDRLGAFPYDGVDFKVEKVSKIDYSNWVFLTGDKVKLDPMDLYGDDGNFQYVLEDIGDKIMVAPMKSGKPLKSKKFRVLKKSIIDAQTQDPNQYFKK